MRFLSPLFVLTALWAQESAEFRNWLNQGAEAFRTTQYGAAIQAFQRAIDLDPSSVSARLYLATAKELNGPADAAEKVFRGGFLRAAASAKK